MTNSAKSPHLRSKKNEKEDSFLIERVPIFRSYLAQIAVAVTLFLFRPHDSLNFCLPESDLSRRYSITETCYTGPVELTELFRNCFSKLFRKESEASPCAAASVLAGSRERRSKAE